MLTSRAPTKVYFHYRLQNAYFVQPTVQIPETFHLQSLMTQQILTFKEMEPARLTFLLEK